MINDAKISEALSRLDAVNDTMTVKRVFGDAYQADGVTVIPVAVVRGGGGGGGGGGTSPDAQQSGSGTGVGFGVEARPLGVFVVKDGDVAWRPAIDVMRVVIGAQLVALASVLVAGRVLLRRRRRH